MARSIFITGTDTGVGKTWFTSRFVQGLRAKGIDAVGFKPIECGGREDSQSLLDASGGNHGLDEINPLWFEAPLAPIAAADAPIDFEIIKKAHQSLADRHDIIVVEGAGGWLVPVSDTETMADLAEAVCEEVIIVALNRLGVLNHTLLTARAIGEREKLVCSSIILNHPPEGTVYPTVYGTVYRSEGYSVPSPDQSVAGNGEMLRRCLPDYSVFPVSGESGVEEFARQW